MKENYFNLIDEPWIPFADDGIVGLKSIFGEKKYRRLGGTPIQKIALMKFLQAITQAAYTPKDEEEWLCLREEELSYRCLCYLDSVYDCFFLYGEKPFLQVPEILQQGTNKINSIACATPEVASGNNTILCQSQIETKLSHAEKAVHLVTLMGFASGGKKWASKNATPGVCLGGLGMLHSFCLGKTLPESLLLNLFTQEDLETHRWKQVPPPWETMPQKHDDARATALSESLTGRLMPLSRFCVLVKEDNTFHTTQGISYASLEDGGFDPSITEIKKKPLWSDPEKRPWRSLSAILSFSPIKGRCIQVEMAIRRAGRLRLDIEMWSGGLRISNDCGEQTPKGGGDDFVESSVLLKTEDLEKWYSAFETEIKALETLSEQLGKCVMRFFKEQSLNNEGYPKKARNLFWQLCERQLVPMIDACYEKNNTMLLGLRQKFARYMHSAFDDVCPKNTARQLDAWAKHRPYCKKYLNAGEING